ncbi:MAG: hypothetical protein DMG61_02895 [Acidobacteria bacterium]|nr:MAG: hypothetical protein DMG61_02895 [Acidobacteriota bacterium]
MLAVIHGYGPNGWRDPNAKQAYLVRHAGNGPIQSRPAPDGMDGAPASITRSEIIFEPQGEPGFLFWTGWQYIGLTLFLDSRYHGRGRSKVETQHAAGLSKLTPVDKNTMSPQGSAAPFAAHLKKARSETPGMQMTHSSPASFCGRTGLISAGKGNSAVGPKTGLDPEQRPPRGCATGLFSTVP